VAGVVKAADGTTVREENARLRSDQIGRWAFTVAVTTHDRLTPGDSTLTVKASAVGKEDAIQREIPITLRE
jgi:hypothetical protein